VKCPNCNQNEVLVEKLDSQRKRVQCLKCGISEVYDGEGRKLLTELPSPNREPLLE
jgi:Zn ribbon nucleic-acid-binding protein